jgi:putative transposase
MCCNLAPKEAKGLFRRLDVSTTCIRPPSRVREKVMRRFKSARLLQRFASVHDQVGNLFMYCRYNTNAQQKRDGATRLSRRGKR